MYADVNNYGLRIDYNTPGYKTFTISLSRKGRGVIKELHGNKLDKLMRELAEWLLEGGDNR